MSERLREWMRTPDARWLLAVVALALLIRLAAVGYIHPDPRDGRFDDTVWYDTAARHLADGKGYVFDPTVWFTADGSRVYPGDDLTPSAVWPPGYPVTLAAVYAVTGDSLWAARLLNVVFGAATVALVYLIARRLFGRTAAIFAGTALALLPAHILYTTILMSETYFGFLLAATIAAFIFLVLDPERPDLRAVFAVGVLAFFTGYTRGEYLVFPFFLVLILLAARWRQALPAAGALMLGGVLVVTPWVIRNQVQMGEFLVGTTGSGRVLWQGHNPEADGQASLVAVFQLEGQFEGLDRTEIELRSNAEGSRMAREWVLDHPVEELKLIPRRMYHLFRSDESGVTWMQSNKPWLSADTADRLIRISNVTFFGLIAVALASSPRWWRPRDPRFWVTFAPVPFCIIAFGVLFIGDPRYHYSLYVPLAIFSSVGFAHLWRVSADQWRLIAGGRSLGQVLRTYGSPRA